MPEVASWTLFQYIWVQIPFQNKQVTMNHKFISPQPLIVPREIIRWPFWQGQGNKHPPSSPSVLPPASSLAPFQSLCHFKDAKIKFSASPGVLFLLQTKRGKVALQLSLPTVVRPHLLRHNLWEIMAKHTGEWKWSAPHLLWREHEHLKKGLLQSRCDRARCMYTVRVLPSSLRGKILFVGKQPLPTGCNVSFRAILLSFLYWCTHTLVSQQEKSSILWSW